MIRLQTVRWKNFLSTGNQFLEVKLDKESMTLVVGKNGAGKSTLIDAITFSLFGKPFKKISKGQLMNTINEKELVTEIEFTVGKTEWKIRRGIKPALFEIFSNGKLVNQDAKSMDYQKYLEEKVLKLNFKSFTQIVVLGSASFVPFMQLSASDRRIIIEDILDIGIFSIMRNLLKDRHVILKEEISEVEYNVKLLVEKIKLHEKQLEELKEKSDKKRKTDLEKIEEAERDIARLHAEIEVHEEVIFTLNKQIKDENSVHKKNSDLDKYRTQINKNLKKLNKDKRFFQEKTNCPTCEQDIDESFKKVKLNDLDDDIDEMNDGLDKLETEVNNVLSRLEDIKLVNDEIQHINSEITSKNGHIKSHNRFINHLNQELKEEAEEVDTGKTNILNRELEEQKGLKTQYGEQKRYYDILGMILNDKGI